MDTKNAACKKCKYFVELKHHNECRRFPPSTNNYYINCFPKITRFSWCGEFIEKE